MHLLVLGVENLLGYHAATAALGRGHKVTVLSPAGQSVVDGAVTITGDRDGDLSALTRGTWDAVLDTRRDPDLGAPTVPRTAELLSGRVGVYGHVAETAQPTPAGAGPGGAPRAGTPVDRDTEDVLTDAFAGPLLLCRTGALVGPRDPSDRFTYWPVRLARANEGTREGPVLVPGSADRTVQYSDARDVADWVVRMLAESRGGSYDAVGPGRVETVGSALDEVASAASGGSPGDVDLVWAGEDWLRDEVADLPDTRRPLWFPEARGPRPLVDSSAAAAAGLSFRSLTETALDTLTWAWDHALAQGLEAGLTEERETEIIARWRAHSGR